MNKKVVSNGILKKPKNSYEEMSSTDSISSRREKNRYKRSRSVIFTESTHHGVFSLANLSPAARKVAICDMIDESIKEQNSVHLEHFNRYIQNIKVDNMDKDTPDDDFSLRKQAEYHHRNIEKIIKDLIINGHLKGTLLNDNSKEEIKEYYDEVVSLFKDKINIRLLNRIKEMIKGQESPSVVA